MCQANVLFLSKHYFLSEKPWEIPVFHLDILLWQNGLRDTKIASNGSKFGVVCGFRFCISPFVGCCHTPLP